VSQIVNRPAAENGGQPDGNCDRKLARVRAGTAHTALVFAGDPMQFVGGQGPDASGITRNFEQDAATKAAK
jgi:hypothetical protein